MAYSLDEQRQQITNEIAKLSGNENSIVRNALEAQLTALAKKSQSKNNRTAVTGDGVTVRIGDAVWELISAPRTYGEEEVNFKKGGMRKRTITAISPDGKSISCSMDGRTSASHYFHSKEAVVASAIKHLELSVKSSKANLDESRRQLDYRERSLERTVSQDMYEVFDVVEASTYV